MSHPARPFLWMGRLNQPMAKLVFLLSIPPALPNAPQPGRSRGHQLSRPCYLSHHSSYLITDHIFRHYHATAGVAAAQDKLVISVLSLAAGVPEGQARDGAPQSLGQGWGVGGTVRRHGAPGDLSITPQHQGLTTPQGSQITAMPLFLSPFLLVFIIPQHLRLLFLNLTNTFVLSNKICDIMSVSFSTDIYTQRNCVALLVSFFLFFFWPCCPACGILVPPAVGAQNLNHWTAGEVPFFPLIFNKWHHTVLHALAWFFH